MEIGGHASAINWPDSPYSWLAFALGHSCGGDFLLNLLCLCRTVLGSDLKISNFVALCMGNKIKKIECASFQLWDFDLIETLSSHRQSYCSSLHLPPRPPSNSATVF